MAAVWDGLQGPHAGEVELVGGLLRCWQKTMILLETRAVEVEIFRKQNQGALVSDWNEDNSWVIGFHAVGRGLVVC